MNTSQFNTDSPFGFVDEREMELPIPSERFRYFRTRRFGLVQFLKRISPEYADDLQTKAALFKEFHICYPLSHPNIIRYTHFTYDAIYSEYIEGLTLREMILREDCRLSDETFIRNAALQLFEALEYMHRHGVRHLDIKPENIMITDKGDILKVIDFGCAESSVFDATSGYTPQFKAPEQGERPTDFTTDIYLAGKVLKELTTISNLKRKWQKFIVKTTAEKPAERFQTASEALEKVPRPKDHNRTYLYISIAISFLALISTIFLYLSYKGESPDKELISALKVSNENQDTKSLSIDRTSTLEGTKAGEAAPMELNPESAKIEKIVSETQKTTPTEPQHDVTISKATGPTVAINNTPEKSEKNKPSMGTDASKKPSDSDSYLMKMLDSKIKGYYTNILAPVVNDKSRFPEGWMSPGGQEAFQAALKKTQDAVLAYGENLASQHPDKKDEIDSFVVNAITSQNLLYLSRFNVK